MNPQLVFVIGAGRSGTTLLMNMLNQHQDVVAPPEHDFLITSLHKFGKKQLSDGDLSIYVKNLWNRKTEFEKLWRLDERTLLQNLQNGERDFPSVFINTLKSYQSEKTPSVVIDKNPYYTVNLGLLKRHFPNAKYIAVVRDVRDRLVSIKRNESKVFKNNILRSAKWSDFNQEIIDLRNEKPTDVFLLKYEDLVLHTEQKLNDLCGFLGISMDAKMMEYDKEQRMQVDGDGMIKDAMNKMHQSSNRRIDPNKIGEWKSKLSDDEVRELSYFCGSMAKELGYDDFPELSESEERTIAKKYKKALIKGRLLFKLKGLSYRLPLSLQRLLSSQYRKRLSK